MNYLFEFTHKLADIESIDRLLRGTLDPDEKRQLEKRLQEEPELRNLYRSLDGLSLAAQRNQTEQKKRMMRKLEKEMTQPVRPLRTRRTYLLRTAVVTLILVLGALLVAHLERNPAPQVFTEVYEPMQDINDGFRSATESSRLSDALEHVSHGAYRRGAKAFERVFEESGDTTHMYFAAVTWIGAGNTQRAEELLITSRSFINDNDFHYYYTLNLVRDNNIHDAKAYLNQQYPEIRPRRIQWLYEQLQDAN